MTGEGCEVNAQYFADFTVDFPEQSNYFVVGLGKIRDDRAALQSLLELPQRLQLCLIHTAAGLILSKIGLCFAQVFK